MPGYEFPEDAARAVALAARHGRWRARTEGSVPASTGLRSVEAAAIISKALAQDEGWLSPARVAQLLDCYGLPLVTTRVVPDADARGRARRTSSERRSRSRRCASGLVHKTDAGGVRLGLDRGRRGARRRRPRSSTRSRAPGTGSTAWSCSRWRRPGSS